MSQPTPPRTHEHATGTTGDREHWLVVGDDRSQSGHGVWSWVAAQPWAGWRVTVVTAQPPKDGAPSELAVPHPWDPEPARELSQADVPVEHVVAEADPRVVLDRYDTADLIVIGPRGPGLLKRLHLGSTAEWLVSGHRPLSPVLIARSSEPVRSVLVCTDGSPGAADAVHTLAAMPLVRGVGVTVLGIDTPQGEAGDAVLDAARELRAAGSGEVRTLLVGAVPLTTPLDVRPTILGQVGRTEPDLVVLGTRGLSGLRRAVLGSTASAVVRHARCSVLVGRADDQARHADDPAPHASPQVSESADPPGAQMS